MLIIGITDLNTTAADATTGTSATATATKTTTIITTSPTPTNSKLIWTISETKIHLAKSSTLNSGACLLKIPCLNNNLL